MMQGNLFSIRLASLHFPRTDGDDEAFLLLGAKSSYILRTLHLTFQEKMVSAANAAQTAQLLDGSIFCCCLPEGMAMLRCKAYETARDAQLDGFLIPQEALRTAWQLCRWKLLFVCAVGWDRHGIHTLSPEEIEQIAMTLKVSRDWQTRLMGMSQKMLGSPVPFSFAITDVPLGQIPVCFSLQAAPEESPETGVISFSAEDAAAFSQKMQTEGSAYQTLRLCTASRKAYQNLRLQYAAPSEEPKVLRNALREELLSYPDEQIWYFSIQVTPTRFYLRPLSPAAVTGMQNGTLPFAALCEEMDTFTAGAFRYAEQLKTELQNAPQSPPKEPSKRGSLLQAIFGKK